MAYILCENYFFLVVWFIRIRSLKIKNNHNWASLRKEDCPLLCYWHCYNWPVIKNYLNSSRLNTIQKLFAPPFIQFYFCFPLLSSVSKHNACKHRQKRAHVRGCIFILLQAKKNKITATTITYFFKFSNNIEQL